MELEIGRMVIAKQFKSSAEIKKSVRRNEIL